MISCHKNSDHLLSFVFAWLYFSEFESKPKIEAVVCLIIILEALWFDERFGGLEDLGALFELKCKAMTLAFDLALHRDPAHRDPSRGSQLESDKAHERRVLWWALMSIDGLYSGPGRMSSINGLEAVDVFLPALSSNSSTEDNHEGCPAGCTASNPLTGVKPRLLMGYVGHEVSLISAQSVSLAWPLTIPHFFYRSIVCHSGETQCLLSTTSYKRIVI